jgi:WD40 repeat protein
MAMVFDQPTSNGAGRAALSADGILATSGNGEGLMRLWDVMTGEMLLEFRTDRTDGPAVGSGWMKFSPDGRSLYYVDGAGTIRKYLLDTDQLIQLAEERLTRGFTLDECRQYLGSTECR